MSMKKSAAELRAQGRGKDTELVHLTKREVRAMEGLAAAAGGKLTRNPKTGLPEAGFLDSLLPTILGFGANMILPGSGMVVGAATGALQNKNDPLMGAVLGGMGGYGGGQLATGIQGLGAGAAQQAAMQAAQPAQALSMEAAREAATQTALNPFFEVVPQEAISAANQAGLQAAADQGAGISNIVARNATDQFMQQPFYTQAQQGLGALMDQGGPGRFVEGMGGGMNTAKAAGLAAAPYLYDSMMPKPGEPMKKPGDGERREFEYDPGYTGGTMTGTDISSERRWFDPTYTRTMAGGGMVRGYNGGGSARGPAAEIIGNVVGRPGSAEPGKMIERQVQVKTASGAPAFDFNQATGTFSPRMEMQRMSQGDAFQQYIRGGKNFSDRMKRGIMGSFARRMNPDWVPPAYAAGGEVAMESGGFVIPADVVSMAGGGSTDAGLGALAKAMGARPIKGAGDGQSDDIPATVDGRPVARVANGEAYVPRDKVARLGGAKKLYAMLDRVRSQAQGHTKQQRPVDLKKALG